MTVLEADCYHIAVLGEVSERCPVVGGSSGRQPMRILPHLVRQLRPLAAAAELGDLLQIHPLRREAPVPLRGSGVDYFDLPYPVTFRPAATMHKCEF